MNFNLEIIIYAKKVFERYLLLILSQISTCMSHTGNSMDLKVSGLQISTHVMCLISRATPRIEQMPFRYRKPNLCSTNASFTLGILGVKKRKKKGNNNALEISIVKSPHISFMREIVWS